jgi:hypothetical protein
MEAVRTSVMSAYSTETTRRYIPESSLRTRRRENLKPHKKKSYGMMGRVVRHILCRRFRGAYCLYQQGDSSPWRCRQQVSVNVGQCLPDYTAQHVSRHHLQLFPSSYHLLRSRRNRRLYSEPYLQAVRPYTELICRYKYYKHRLIPRLNQGGRYKTQSDRNVTTIKLIFSSNIWYSYVTDRNLNIPQ